VGGSVVIWSLGDDVRRVREVVARGGVLAVPTESSYALAVDPRSRSGVDAVFRIKGRKPDKPLPVVIPGVAVLGDLDAELPEGGLQGLERGWPGALSILVNCRSPLAAAAGGSSVAVRIPDHPGLLRLLSALGMGLTATSANRSGEPPILAPELLEELMAGEDAMIVDGGRLPGGEPSTLVAIERGAAIVLRAGRVSRSELVRLAPALFSAEPVEIPVEESR